MVENDGLREIQDLAALFNTLGDPSRLELLLQLTDGEKCVHELTEVVGISQSAVSHQLRILRDRRLVRAKRQGRHIYYSLDDDHVLTLLSQTRDHLGHQPGAA